MTVAIGGWLLLAVASGSPVTIDGAVKRGVVVKGYDTADECEDHRQAGQVCVPALATVNR